MPKTTITTSIRDLVPGDRVFLANRLQRDHHGIVIALHTDRQGVTSVIVKHLSGHYAGQRAVITSFERETFEVVPEQSRAAEKHWDSIYKAEKLRATKAGVDKLPPC